MHQLDTVIAGGTVIDPSSAVNGRFDLGIRAGRVAAIETQLESSSARHVVDATGMIVTPGLVDLHTHVYWGVTYWGIEADPVAARTGVTTWLDVGSAGGYNFPGFREFICKPSRSRIYALLNLSSIGLTAPTWEFANPDYCDVDLAQKIIEANRDIILGVKARIDNQTTRGVGIFALERARELADRVDLPLMVHIGSGPPALDDILPLLRPGDILTHCFTGRDNRLLGQDNLAREDVLKLRDAGLVLDIGHGTGSFNFDVAERMLEQDVLPDVISSDIHQMAVQGPMFDLPTTLSKFVNLGMELPDVIERATSKAAAAMRKPELGSLAVGAIADVAMFRVEQGDFTFYDADMNARPGSTRITCTAVLIDGEPMPDVPEREFQPWTVLPKHQQPVLQAGVIGKPVD